MRWRAWLWVALTLAGAGHGAEVGRVHGVAVGWRLPAAGEPSIAGRLYTVTAAPTSRAGLVEARHDGPLAPSAAAAIRAAGESLASLAGSPYDLGERLPASGVLLGFGAWSGGVAGGSAGLPLAVAAASALLDVPVDPAVVISGQITPAGGLVAIDSSRTKLDAALAAGAEILLVPAATADELADGASLELQVRTRVIGVGRLDQALFVAFGPAGPSASDWLAYDHTYRDGLTALAAGDAATARARLELCHRYLPHDTAVRFWLSAAPSPANRAGALAALGRWDEARAVGGGELSESLTTALLAGEAAQRRTRCLVGLDAAVERGDWRVAEDLLHAATATLALAPGGAPAVRAARQRLATAKLRLAAEQAPADPAVWRAWARQASADEAWADAAEAWRGVREAGADGAEVRCAEAEALRRLGRDRQAAELLLARLGDWPAHLPTRALLAQLGLDALPPTASLAVEPNGDGRYRLLAGASENDCDLRVLLDDAPLAAGRGHLQLDWKSAVTGGHRLTVIATDRAGNVGLAETYLELGPPRRLPRGMIPAAEPFEVSLLAPGFWLLRPEDHAAPDARALFGGAGLDDLRLGVGGGGMQGGALRPAADGPVADLELWAQAGERAVGPARFRLVRLPGPLATIREARPGETLALVLSPGAPEPVFGRLVVDGEVVGSGSPSRLRLPALPAGDHVVAVVLSAADGRHWQTPPVMVTGS